MRIRDEYLHGSDLTGVVKKIEVTTGTGNNANQSVIKYTKADSAGGVVEVPIGDITGKAATASKLDNTSAIGSKTNPVYFTANGVPSACTYSLNATVPAGTANKVLYYSALNTLDVQSYTTLTSNLDVFTAATSSAAGKKGLVPAPAANQLGTKNFFLRADGVWTVIENKSAALNGTATSLVTTGEKYNWNSAYNWYNSMTSGDTDGVINKWKEVEAFLANYGDSSTLAAELAKLVTLSTDQTITGVKTFSEVINGSITGNAGTANKLYPTDHGKHIVINKSEWKSVNVLTTGFTNELGDYTLLLVPGGSTNTASLKLIRNGNVLIGTSTDTGHKLQVEGDIYTTTGFKKEGSSDDYVLLAGGGHKALTDFSMAHEHPYLPLAGGTLTGTLTLPQGNSLRFGDRWYHSDTWNIANTGDNLGITILNAVGTAGTSAPSNYAIGLSVSGYYSMQIAAYGSGDHFWIRAGKGKWEELYHSSNLTASVIGNLGTLSNNISGNAATASNAESAIKSDYLTTRYIGSDGDTVAQVKLKILDSYTSLYRKQGYSIHVNSSFIENYSNDDYVTSPLGAYSLTYLTPGYGGKSYGQWLAAYFGSERLYVFGRNNNLWTERKTIAWTSDIPTKVSAFTNDAGYLTSHAYSYGSIDIYDINGAKKTSNNTVSASVNTETLRLQEGANISITATNSGDPGSDNIKIAVTGIESNINQNGYGQLALWRNGASSVSAILRSATFNETLVVKAGSGIDFSAKDNTVHKGSWTISAIPYNCAITLNNNSTKSLIKDSWSADGLSVYLTSDGTSSGSSLAAGTYALWIEDRSSASGTPNYYSGTFTCAGRAAAGRLDEIALHSSMATNADTNAPTRIFVATQISGTSGKHVLRFCSLDSSATSHFLTVKVNRII